MARLGRFKSSALQLTTNLVGWKTTRKLVVFESDDWGATRMPGRIAWKRLLAAGIRVDQSPYDRLDCLEKQSDFQSLMNVIDAHRDDVGQPAVFTFNTILGNPDFEAIELDQFEKFHHQHFFDTYRKNYGENLESDWGEAIQSGLIRPQFHGREHLNVPLWMNDLRAGLRQARLAFEHEFFGLTTRTSSARQTNYLASFWAESRSELASVCERLSDGLKMFHQTFGFRARTFIACNYILPEQAERVLKDHRVELLQGQRGQFVPLGNECGGRIERAFTGKRNASGLLRTVRNVKFEPFENPDRDWVGFALNQIKQSFLFRTPAIVSTHRVNYVSDMDCAHRDRNLNLLDGLLGEIRRRWPDVEFLSSDQLLNEMLNA